MAHAVQVQPIQLNLPPFLAQNRQELEAYPNSPLKQFYSNPEVQTRVNTTYVEAVKKTVPKTTIAGGLIGCAVSLSSGVGTPLTIAYIAKTTLIGAGVGAVAGVVYEAKKISIEIRQDQTYTNWKKGIEQPILDRYQEVLNSPAFQGLTCCILYDIPKIAVRDNFGRLYDQETIFKWIDDHGTHPSTRQPLRRSDLTFDAGFAGDLMRASDPIFGDPNIVSRGLENEAEIVKGLKAALESCIKNHNDIVLITARTAMRQAEAAGLPPMAVHQIYQRHMAAFIDRPAIEEPRLSGITAIVTSESLSELGTNIVREAPAIINSFMGRADDDDYPVVIRADRHAHQE